MFLALSRCSPCSSALPRTLISPLFEHCLPPSRSSLISISTPRAAFLLLHPSPSPLSFLQILIVSHTVFASPPSVPLHHCISLLYRSLKLFSLLTVISLISYILPFHFLLTHHKELHSFAVFYVSFFSFYPVLLHPSFVPWCLPVCQTVSLFTCLFTVSVTVDEASTIMMLAQ